MKFNDKELEVLDELVTKGPTEYHDIEETSRIEALDSLCNKGALVRSTFEEQTSYKINPSVSIPITHAIHLFKQIETRLEVNSV